MTYFPYLERLLNEVNELCERISFRQADLSSCTFSYMPTKKTYMVGFKQGYYDLLNRLQNGLKTSDNLRKNTKNYLRFVNNCAGELIQIDVYRDGRLNCLYQVYWSNHKRFLLPYSANGGFYPAYTYVTNYEDGKIIEEYMVRGNHIIHEAYTPIHENSVQYHSLTYVPGGEFPVMEEREGILHLDPLTFEETYYDNWLNHA